MQFLRILCFLLIIATFACREDFERNVAIPVGFEASLLDDYQGEVAMVTSSVKGIVMDEDESPIIGALVSLNGLITTTDQFGHFFFIDVAMNTLGAVVNVSIQDYHQGSELFYPEENATENLEVVLTKIKSIDEVDGLSSGTITLDGGLEFTYPENSFLKSDGSNHQGTVFIGTTYSDNGNLNFSRILPGNQQAVNINNKLVGIAASSILQLSIYDNQGNHLNINDAAEILIAFPNAINSEESVWYYADKFGLYTFNSEFSNGSQQSIRYKHNTSLLIGKTIETEHETLSLVAANGMDALTNLEVETKDASNNTISRVFSNSLGHIAMPVLNDGSSILQIKDACGNVVFNNSWSEVSNELSLQEVNTKTLAGDVYDCLVNPNENSVIRVLQGNRTHYYYEPNSSFTLQLQTCGQGIAKISALDNSSSDLAALPASSIEDLEFIGDLFTCENPSINMLSLVDTESGIQYQYPITSTVGTTQANSQFSNEVNEGNRFEIVFNGSTAGDYSDPAFHSIENIFDDASELRISGDAEIFEVVKFGNENRVTVGSFEGVFLNTFNNEMINIKGNFNFYFDE